MISSLILRQAASRKGRCLFRVREDARDRVRAKFHHIKRSPKWCPALLFGKAIHPANHPSRKANQPLLKFNNHASTKVRHYGDSYRLDRVHGKQRPEESNQIEKLVSKLPKKARSTHSPTSYCELLIAYVPQKSDFERLLRRTDDPEFLARYKLSFAKEEWKDPHHRGFWTGLFLWTYQKDAERHS